MRYDYSQHSRRKLDNRLALGLVSLLLLYLVITFGVFLRVPDASEDRRVFFELKETHRHAEAALNIQPPEGALGKDIPRYDTATSVDFKAIAELQKVFPVHVGSDTEVIPHPGFVFAKTKKPDDVPGTVTVPRFWDPPPYGDVRRFLGNYGKQLITPEQALAIGSKVGDLETIYVSVASYRDPECAPTVESVFLRAKHPERIRVAVILQREEGDPTCKPETPCSEDPQQTLCKYDHLIDHFEMKAALGCGPVFARHLAHRHYRGEYFAMQVDSHVRFVTDWDEDLIGQWKSAHNEMAVLTTYLSDIQGRINPVTHASQYHNRPIMCKSDYESNGKLKHLRHGQQPEGPPGIHGTPTLHPFWAAGFSFARGHFVVQVPYDQYLPMVFQGEEISMGLRGFTFGYDYYAPERSVCFHMYAIKENQEKRKKVKLFWENNALYSGAPVEAMKRLNGIIGMGDPTDYYYHKEEDRYGLGQVRTKEKFFHTFGIHTETQTVEHHLCRFVGKPMQALLIPHLRENHMGINYDEIDYAWVDPEPDVPDPNMGTLAKKQNQKPAAAAKPGVKGANMLGKAGFDSPVDRRGFANVGNAVQKLAGKAA